MKKDPFDVLVFLAKSGALGRGAKLTTTQIAKAMGRISQQTASRWLSQLESEGEIERSGRKTALTQKGRATLFERLGEIEAALEEGKRPGAREETMSGAVETGLGEGKYYVALAEYSRQLKRALGFKPYPGTLNLRLSAPEDIAKSSALRQKAGIPVTGFERGGRSMGTAKCFPCYINGEVEGAVIVPARTHYGPDVVEVLAPVWLRERLRLRDGSKVTLEVADMQ
jgi:riboflavin kinase